MATLRELLGDAYKSEMTIADVEIALNGKNLVDLTEGQYVFIGKYNSAIAERDDFKAKYTSTLSEAKKAELANEEKENHYKAIEKENSIYKYIDKLSPSIKDKTVLSEVATLMADGKFVEAIEKQNAYIAKENAELENRIKDELMKTNPQANPHNNTDTVTKEQFANMGVAERTKLYKEQPELYKQLNEN